MTERWRLLEHYAEEAGRNMAVDEALLLDGSQGEPVLRLYSFGPPALSLGYFQRFDDVPAAARLPHVVRRMTGGGAIHHAEELTFSIAAPADHPIYCGEVSGSYERVHAAIASALAPVRLNESRSRTSDVIRVAPPSAKPMYSRACSSSNSPVIRLTFSI